MPCWLKTENTLDLGKADAALLEQTLQELGFTINGEAYSRSKGYTFSADHFGQVRADLRYTSVVRTRDGKIKVIAAEQGNLDAATKAVAQGYARKVIDTTAKKFGWLDRKANAEGTSGRLLRRRF